MSNLFSLLKIEFSKFFTKNSFKENKAKTTSFLVILALVVILGIGISSLYSYIYGKTFIDAGIEPYQTTIMFASVSTMIGLFSGVTQSRAIFIGNDYDFLSSLPIKKRDIVASKVLNLYAIELLFSAILMIPNGIVNFILTNNYKFLLVGLLLTIFISAFPLVIAMIFSFVSCIISSKFKYGNIVSIILYTIFIAAIFIFSFMMNTAKTAEAQANLLNNIVGVIVWFNPTVYFVNLAFSNNILYILVFAGINFVLLSIVILVFALFFDRIHEIVNSMNSDYKYEAKKLKTKKQFQTLLGLEFKRLFSSKMYFFNSSTGLIVTILMSVFMGVVFSKYSPFPMNDNVLAFVKQYGYVGALIIIFGLTIANTASVGISIEGKNFWLIKSLPINYKKYMYAKLALAFILILPISLISSTIMCVFIGFDLLNALSIYLVPLAAIAVSIFASLLINLAFYKLRWSNEQEVVKSSMAVVLSMLVGFGMDIVVAALLIGLGFVNKIVAIVSTLGVLVIVAAILYIILNKNFVKKIIEIEDF